MHDGKTNIPDFFRSGANKAADKEQVNANKNS